MGIDLYERALEVLSELADRSMETDPDLEFGRARAFAEAFEAVAALRRATIPAVLERSVLPDASPKEV